MKVVAVVPARSGSKGIKHKNILKLRGHPLLAYSVTAGVEAKLVDRTICSTDSARYARIAKSYGAEVPFLRPKAISQNSSSDWQFLRHLVKFMQEEEGYFADLIVLLRPTSPVRKRDLVDRAIRRFLRIQDAHSLRTIAESPVTPYKMWHPPKNDLLRPLLGSIRDHHFDKGRQKLKKFYYQTGSIDVIRVDTITVRRNASGTNIGYIKIPYEEYCDIDRPEEFALAEYKLKKGVFVTPRLKG